MFEDDYELEAAYAENPDELTSRVIAAAANAAALEVAQIHQTRRDEEYGRLFAGQTESAGIAALDALRAKYADEIDRLAPRIQERLQTSPHLVPESALTSPTQLAEALDDVVRLARDEQASEDRANHWQGVKSSYKNIYVGNGPLGGDSDA